MARTAKAPTIRPIWPLHHSYGGRSRRPYGMETIVVKPEMDECLQRIAIEIFNDCVNAGQPFQVALAAIYMSGLSNAHDILAEARSKEAPTPLERWDDPHA